MQVFTGSFLGRGQEENIIATSGNVSSEPIVIKRAAISWTRQEVVRETGSAEPFSKEDLIELHKKAAALK